MEIWVLMWMLMYEADGGKVGYQPRSQEVVGTLDDCKRVARELRLYYIEKKIRYGNVICVNKDDLK